MPNHQAGQFLGIAIQKLGFTLLELIFALSVVAVFVTLGVGQYKRMAVEKDIELVKYNVDLIFQAANQCFWMKRDNDSKDPIKKICTKDYLQKLPPDGLGIWPVLFLKNNKLTPSDDDYNFSIVAITGVVDSYIVNVKVTLPNIEASNSSLLQWYVNRLNASSSISNVLVWSRMPTYSIPTAETNLWISNAQLQQFRSIMQSP